MSSSDKKKPPSSQVDVVLSSCGVRVPCFVGALSALETRGYEIQRIAGTSGGAIIAAAHSLGMGIPEMLEITARIPYDSFRDFKIRNLLSAKNPSVYTGKALDKFYQELFGEAQLKDFKKDCYISVVTIIGRNRIVLSKNTHPDLPVWEAVRMSSTIPFIFPYHELEGIPVTDGGLVTGIFDIFPDNQRTTIALRPKANYFLKRVVQDVQVDSMFIWNYLKVLAEYFLDAVDNQHVPQGEWEKTIVIPTFDIGGFSFNITPEEVQKLVWSGYNAVMEADVLPPID